MSYIQLGKTLEKSPNKSGEGHRRLGVKYVPQLQGMGREAEAKRRNRSMPESERWNTDVYELIRDYQQSWVGLGLETDLKPNCC